MVRERSALTRHLVNQVVADLFQTLPQRLVESLDIQLVFRCKILPSHDVGPISRIVAWRCITLRFRREWQAVFGGKGNSVVRNPSGTMAV